MKNIDYSKVKITGGFWAQKQKMLRDSTVDAVYNRFSETKRFSALECKWREGESWKPHFFWDSDVAKWVEGVSYLLAFEPNEKWRKIIENVIDNFIKNQDENGYFNSYFLVTEQDMRFKERGNHELYCLGHWIEAAVAYFEATGERRFLDAVCKFVDYVERVFKIERSAPFITPGHPEIELALVRLYEATGERRYLDLSLYFINEHGANPADPPPAVTFPQNNYNQDDVRLRDRKTIDGHAVRALYLLSGMIDVADILSDEELKEASLRMMASCINKRMYVTGGVGSLNEGEAFSDDYYLPNRTAYAETCAAISLAMAAERMLKLEENAKYADVVERAIYNGCLSGISMDGEKFFYINPLEIDLDFNNVHRYSQRLNRRYPITQRVGVFECSCCPPNITRLIASVSGYALAENDETIFVNQFMSLESDDLSVKTNYPVEEAVHIIRKNKNKRLAVRIPGWCSSFKINADYEMKNGYAYVTSDAKTVTVEFDMAVKLVASNRRVHVNAGRVAVMRGPIVYCAEGVDNFKDLKAALIEQNACFETKESEFIIPALETEALVPKETAELYPSADELEYERVKLTLIPYNAFANRGSSDMQIWFLKK